jgi:fructose-specific phosphotransferase system IIC component
VAGIILGLITGAVMGFVLRAVPACLILGIVTGILAGTMLDLAKDKKNNAPAESTTNTILSPVSEEENHITEENNND